MSQTYACFYAGLAFHEERLVVSITDIVSFAGGEPSRE